MKFNKIIGKSKNPKISKIIFEAEQKLSQAFLDLSLNSTNKNLGSGLGGDPLTLQLVYPVPHVCDASAVEWDEDTKELINSFNDSKGKELTEEEKKEASEEISGYRSKLSGRLLRTAATDGKRFYWNPEFVNKQSLIGLRIVIAHEAWHAIYMHPARRGGRMPRLWNIAVDYKVNYNIMEDLKCRGIGNNIKMFEDNLGKFIYLEEYAAFLKNPFEPPARLAHLNPIHSLKGMADPAYKHPGENAEPMYYAEPNLSGDFKKPEHIYQYLLSCIPKCPKCGKLGKYKKPEEYKELEKKIKEQEKQKADQKEKEEKDQKAKENGEKSDQSGENHSDEHGDCNDSSHNHSENGEPCEHDCKDHEHGSDKENGNGEKSSSDEESNDSGNCCDDKNDSCDSNGGCSECGNDDSEYVDPFGAGELMDEHLESDCTEEELAKRLSDASEAARKMGGTTPAGLQDELGELIAPKLTWQDFVRSKLRRMRDGIGRTDWTRPKSRPMFAGLFVPKKRDHFLSVLAAYDCSGSMSQDDIAFGISQLQVIDDKGEINLVSWDCVTYWNDMVKIKKADKENLNKAKIIGRGGTECSSVFNEYEEHCGKVDMIVIITDGFLSDGELKNVKIPNRGVETLWLVTSDNPHFKPPFGKVMHLRNE